MAEVCAAKYALTATNVANRRPPLGNLKRARKGERRHRVLRHGTPSTSPIMTYREKGYNLAGPFAAREVLPLRRTAPRLACEPFDGLIGRPGRPRAKFQVQTDLHLNETRPPGA